MCLNNVFIMEMISLAVAYLALAEMHWEVAASFFGLGMSEDFRFFVFFRCLGTLMGSSSESASESIIVKTLLCLEITLYKKPYLSYRKLSDILKTLLQRIKSFQKPSGLGGGVHCT